MKYKKGDRVSCTFGHGEIKDTKEAYNLVPYNFYQIKLDNEKYKEKLFWFAEHELKLEPEVKCECEKEWRTRETLERIIARFEQEKASCKIISCFL